jgi:hypothetical protein
LLQHHLFVWNPKRWRHGGPSGASVLKYVRTVHLEMSFADKRCQSCLANRETIRVLKENFELVRDVGLLNNVLVSVTLELHFSITRAAWKASALLATTPASPCLLPGMIANASKVQRAPDPWSFLCGSSPCAPMNKTQQCHNVHCLPPRSALPATCVACSLLSLTNCGP